MAALESESHLDEDAERPKLSDRALSQALTPRRIPVRCSAWLDNMIAKKLWKWNGGKGYRYYLGQLPAETFREKIAYELLRIETSSNLQRGQAWLDTRFGRKIIDDNAILEEAFETAPTNVRKILKRFVV